jgi:hypothetical protein
VHVARVVEQPWKIRAIRGSPDGGRLALTVGPGGWGNVWIYDQPAAQPLKLTFKGTTFFQLVSGWQAHPVPPWEPESHA